MRLSSFALFSSLFLLSGCGSLLDPFGANQEAKLPGQRLAILSAQTTLSVDPALEGLVYTFPPSESQPVWPQQYGNSQHLLPNLQWAGDWQRVWKANIGVSFDSDFPLQAAPIIAGNQVFALDNAYTTTALNLTDGTLLWQANDQTEVTYSQSYGGGLALGSGKLVVTTGYGDVFALNPLDGSELWREPLRLPIRGAPTIVNDIAIVQTLDSQAFAFDLSDGSERWYHSGINEITSVVNHTAPTADAERVFIAYNSGEIAALSSRDGVPLWLDTLSRFRRNSDLARINTIGASPVLFGNYLLICGYSDQMVLFNAQTGQRVWETALGTLSIPILSNNALFLLANDQRFYSLDLASGKVRWITEPNLALLQYRLASENAEEGEEIVAEDVTSYRFNTPVMIDGKLMTVSTEGIVLEIDPIDGKVVAERTLEQGSLIPLQVVGDTLLMLSTNGEISAYR